MPIDSEAIKIHTEGVWASAPGADRKDPEDPTLSPPLSRRVGWPASFSTDGGNPIRREPTNQRFHELDTAVNSGIVYGIYPYDARVNYKRNESICQIAGVLYRAIADNGPDLGGAESPTAAGQTSWETLVGSEAVPDAPAAPVAVSGNGWLEWRWHCPRDNGAVVSSFVFQWRQQGVAWLPANQVIISPSR